jgi:hypothetical protein
MRRLLSLILAGVFSVTLFGCRAEVDTTGDDHGRTVKKETTIKNDGGYSKEETKVYTNP